MWLVFQVATNPSGLVLDDESHQLNLLRVDPKLLAAEGRRAHACRLFLSPKLIACCCYIIDAFGHVPLHYAIEAGNMQQIQWLLRLGAVAAMKTSAMQKLLLLPMSKPLQKFLLQQLEEVDVKNYRHLVVHGAHSDEECELGLSIHALSMLQQAMEPHSGPRLQSGLHKAALYGNLEAVELLLKRKVDVNARDTNGWTALHVRRLSLSGDFRSRPQADEASCNSTAQMQPQRGISQLRSVC